MEMVEPIKGPTGGLIVDPTVARTAIEVTPSRSDSMQTEFPSGDQRGLSLQILGTHVDPVLFIGSCFVPHGSDEDVSDRVFRPREM